jgi:hypothetical protein
VELLIADINGMDVQGHGDSPEKSIESIRDWLKEVRFLVSAKSGTSASVKVRLINPDKST